MERTKTLAAILLVVVAFGFLFVSVRPSHRPADAADAADSGPTAQLIPRDKAPAAPDFALPDAATGKNVHLAQQAKRQPVVLDFWATWCGPCRMELPHVQALSERYKGRVAFYGINSSDSSPVTRQFAQENRLSFPMLTDAKHEAAEQYGVASIPLLVLVDTNGQVRFVSNGYDEGLEPRLVHLIDSLLTETRTAARPSKFSS